MVPMFRVQFHTGMLKLQPKGRNKHVAVFPLSDLDDAYKDKRSLLLTYTFIDFHSGIGLREDSSWNLFFRVYRKKIYGITSAKMRSLYKRSSPFGI